MGNRELGLSPKQGRENLTTDLNDFHRLKNMNFYHIGVN
jgi:hypothetical protein